QLAICYRGPLPPPFIQCPLGYILGDAELKAPMTEGLETFRGFQISISIVEITKTELLDGDKANSSGICDTGEDG
ncbi:MAG: hypothetical protein AAFU84_16955, partial [Cyanobacteria bacterium J06633_23]